MSARSLASGAGRRVAYLAFLWLTAADECLDLIGEEGVAVDFERGRVFSIEKERKRLRVREFLVGDVGMGGIGI